MSVDGNSGDYVAATNECIDNNNDAKITESDCSSNDKAKRLRSIINLLNPHLFYGFVIWGISLFLPFININTLWGEESLSIADNFSTVEIFFLIALAVIGAYSSAKGFFPLVAKIIAALIVLGMVITFIDFYRTSPIKDIKMMLSMMDININFKKAKDIENIISLIGSGLVLYVVSFITLTTALFKPVKAGPQNDVKSASSEATKQYLKSSLNLYTSITKLQLSALKKALLAHDITEQKKRIVLEKVNMTKAASQKDVKHAFLHLAALLKQVFEMGKEYTKVSFKTNVMGKALVILSLVTVFFIIF
jgi:hypothetical protein